MKKIAILSRLALVVLALGAAVPTQASVVEISGPNRPSLPLFGPGRTTNVLDNEGTLTMGLMHAGWSVAAPLLGEHAGGRKGLWIAGLTWMTANVVEQSMFHAPASPAEVRGSMLMKLVPCVTVLALDLARHGF